MSVKLVCDGCNNEHKPRVDGITSHELYGSSITVAIPKGWSADGDEHICVTCRQAERDAMQWDNIGLEHRHTLESVAKVVIDAYRSKKS